MLTLSVSGKDKAEALRILKEAISSEDPELKVQIDDPSQGAEIQKYLESEGYSNVIPEDDDGTLFLMASKKPTAASEPEHNPETPEASSPRVRQAVTTEPKSFGVVLSRECRKHERKFMEKVIASLNEAKTKADILCLMNDAVNLAAYDTHSCDILKKLEADGVRVLISKTCSDRLGITEALGAGVLVSLSEILEAVSTCEKLLSL